MSFELRILHQEWSSPDAGSYDICSHGHIFLKVHDIVLSDEEQNWTINVTGLLLLKSLRDGRHTVEFRHQPMFNCCGGLLEGMGCYVCADWNVRFEGDDVILDDFRTWYSQEEGKQFYPGLQVRMSRERYREQVLSFARQAKEFYFSTPKQIFDEWERELTEKFWKEYDELLHRL
ncbi:hypothetical protein [Tumebacillus flagellatus]|uniref:Uncharacterized protein n=1 Tax=Tumebacillus flagellatus TaxID=1157490 RepID=A0A074LKV1_9BACL|nr:hypothetical protein [Tumebacillus flagellatus]KEO82761.1 hypothetical protein EL26_13510 [Tumebacillus flagellatus]